MRRLIFWLLVVAALWALFVTACARRPTVADLFTEDFASASHPYYDYGDGSPGYPLLTYWPAYGTYASGGWRAENAKLVIGQGVSVYAGEGKGGSKKGLWCADDPAVVMPYDSNASWHVAGIDTLSAVIAGPMEIRASIRYKTAGFHYDAVNDYYPNDFDLLTLIDSGSAHIQLNLYNDGDEVTQDWKLGVAWPSTTYPAYSEIDISGDWDTWVDDVTWRDFVVSFKPSTVTGWSAYPTGATVTADGWLKVTVNGTTLFDLQNIDLVFNTYGRDASGGGGSAGNVNTVLTLNVAGMAGAYDSLGYGPSATWINIADWVDVELDSADYPGSLARVLCELWTEDVTPAPTMKARLYNVTDSVSAGESADVTAHTPTAADFAVTLATGVKRYRLQVTADTSAVDLFAIGAGVVS